MFLRHSSPTTMSLGTGHFAAQAKGFNAGRSYTRLQVRTVLKSPRQGNASFESKMQNVPARSIAETYFSVPLLLRNTPKCATQNFLRESAEPAL